MPLFVRHMRTFQFILFVAFEVALFTTTFLFPEGLSAIYVYASYFLLIFLAVVYGLLCYFPNAFASASIFLKNIGGAIFPKMSGFQRKKLKL